eukprot:scaffold9.g3273.t1
MRTLLCSLLLLYLYSAAASARSLRQAAPADGGGITSERVLNVSAGKRLCYRDLAAHPRSRALSATRLPAWRCRRSDAPARAALIFISIRNSSADLAALAIATARAYLLAGPAQAGVVQAYGDALAAPGQCVSGEVANNTLPLVWTSLAAAVASAVRNASTCLAGTPLPDFVRQIAFTPNISTSTPGTEGTGGTPTAQQITDAANDIFNASGVCPGARSVYIPTFIVPPGYQADFYSFSYKGLPLIPDIEQFRLRNGACLVVPSCKARPDQRASGGQAGSYDEAAIKAKVEGLIANTPVVVFSWTGCPYCKRAKALLDSLGARYTAVELDTLGEGSAYRAELAKITGRTSVPAVFITSQFVGGCNDGGLGGVVTLSNDGCLLPLLQAAGAL